MISNFLPSEGSQAKGTTSETVQYNDSDKWDSYIRVSRNTVSTLKTIRCRREVRDCFCISLKPNQTPVTTQELYLDEKIMPHVYVIVSRIWARWEKSIENKISKRYCWVVPTYCLGRAPTNFHVAECQSFVEEPLIFTSHAPLRSGCVHLNRDNLRWNSCIQLIQKRLSLYGYLSVRAQTKKCHG